MKYTKTALLAAISLGVSLAKKRTPPEIAAFWTNEKRQDALSRDVVVDPQSGEAFVREAGGGLEPLLREGRRSNRNLRGSSWDKRQRQLQSIVANDNVANPTPSHLQAVGRLFFCIGSETRCFSCTGEL